jgi:hypothetical protein
MDNICISSIHLGIFWYHNVLLSHFIGCLFFLCLVFVDQFLVDLLVIQTLLHSREQSVIELPDIPLWSDFDRLPIVVG